jgi:hypothetical protein
LIGPEETFEITMPRDRTNKQIVLKVLIERFQVIFERYPNAFPLLKHIFGL